MTQVIEHLPSKYEDLSLNLTTAKEKKRQIMALCDFEQTT
jgi:hypothetical protein